MMSSQTKGKLHFILDSLYWPDEDNFITQITFEPDSPVEIVSMIDTKTGEEADIVGNIASMKFSTSPEEYMEFDIECFCDVYMFGGTVTIYKSFEIDNELQGESSETFRVLGQVPFEGEGDKITKLANPTDRRFETISLQLTNLNIYKEALASIKLHAEDEDIEFEAVGKPIKTDSSIVISMVEHRGKTYIVNDFDKSMRFFADTLRPNFWDLAPEKSIEPIVMTYSFPKDMGGELWSISYAAYNSDGIRLSTGVVDVQIPTSVDIGGGGGSNGSFELWNCYPNPAENTVNFQFELFEYYSKVNLTITDAAGIERARLLDNKGINKGKHVLVFNSEGLTSGTYYYTIEIDKMKQTKPLVIVK
jgi:type IX secretion system substrate protein